MTTLGLCAAIEPTPAAALCMGTAFTLERALSGLAVTSFPLAKNTGLAHTFATAADRRRVRGVLVAASLLLSLLLIWWAVRWQQLLPGWYSGITTVPPSDSLAASAVIWPAGLSSGRNSGCWRLW